MLSRDDYIPLLFRAFRENSIPLNDGDAERLYLFSDRLLAVNEQFNLTAIREPFRVALLHMADCAAAARAFPEGARVIDVGCGAGFPSLPLAILRPDLSVVAMDATAKKVGFVKETAELLGLSNITAINARAEDAAINAKMRESFDAATARAVAALPVLCELCLPFVKMGGVFLAMKGKNAREELDAAENAIRKLGGELEAIRDEPLTGEGESFARAEIVIRKTKPTPREYPRAYGKILKKPL